jgi:trehalose-6-phosphate synthase
MSKEEGKSLRLLVVSNRLPVTVTKNAATNDYDFKMSSGGLVAALSGLKKQMSFTWIGWPGRSQQGYHIGLLIDTGIFFYILSLGIDVPTNERKHLQERLLNETSTLPVFVDEDLAELHYNGFSNR